MTDLRTIAYRSRASKPLDALALAQLLIKAQKFNDSVGVTGLLSYVNEEFFQTIEGTHDAVATVFDRICRDPQHVEIATVVDAPIRVRAYPTWAMMTTTNRSSGAIRKFLEQRLANIRGDLADAQMKALRTTLHLIMGEAESIAAA